MKKELLPDVGILVIAFLVFGILSLIISFVFSISDSYRIILFISGFILILIGIYGAKGLRKFISEK